MRNNRLPFYTAAWLLIITVIPIFSPAQNTSTGKHGSISSAHPLATRAGMAILQQGGNAFDAAIAVAATLNVTEPMMSGIGGYGTVLIYDAATKKIRFLNCSGRFPLQTNTDLMRPPTPGYRENRTGPKSISTPGNLNAWAALHETYGALKWDKLFDSAIHHAENGYLLTESIAKLVADAYPDFSPAAKNIYGSNNVPLQKGDQLVQTDLAQTFRLIAREGATVFYHGILADRIAAQMKASGSFLTKEDLQKNTAEWGAPLHMTYKGFDIYTASLPANSFAAYVPIGLMQKFSAEKPGHNTTPYLHLFAEMAKLSYRARLAFSFDPDIKKAPIDSLLSDAALSAAAAAISRDTASLFTLPFSPESRNTTHFVVADKWGNVVSATQTLGNSFGSRIMVEGTGIWMNNSMAYSTFEPKGNPMDAFPGRHKLSGDCPVIIMKNNKTWAALGTPGGHTITQNVPQIIFNLIDFSMTMQQAIDAPKIAFAEPDIIRADHHLSQEVFEQLKKMGHRMQRGSIGNAHGIRILRNKKGKITGFDAGADKRTEGRQALMVDR